MCIRCVFDVMCIGTFCIWVPTHKKVRKWNSRGTICMQRSLCMRKKGEYFAWFPKWTIPNIYPVTLGNFCMTFASIAAASPTEFCCQNVLVTGDEGEKNQFIRSNQNKNTFAWKLPNSVSTAFQSFDDQHYTVHLHLSEQKTQNVIRCGGTSQQFRIYGSQECLPWKEYEEFVNNNRFVDPNCMTIWVEISFSAKCLHMVLLVYKFCWSVWNLNSLLVSVFSFQSRNSWDSQVKCLYLKGAVMRLQLTPNGLRHIFFSAPNPNRILTGFATTIKFYTSQLSFEACTGWHFPLLLRILPL